MNRRTLILTPEPPYPLHSGGAYRTASLVHYFARFTDVDLVLISESGRPALLPKGIVRSQQVIALPQHSRSTAARYWRNARRAIEGVPPLVDRLSGLDIQLRHTIGANRYDFGLVEHFWCAPYLEQVARACGKTILDLHNIESSLHARCAMAGNGMQAVGHRRFAQASRRLESELFAKFDLVMVTSGADLALARQIEPETNLCVYPNALPYVAIPRVEEDPNLIVFSGNFEYHPNADALAYFVRHVWPSVLQQIPQARVRLVGRGIEPLRQMITGEAAIEATGPLEDALGEIAKAAVVIAPLRAGSGTRIKILEGWAAAKAIVATPLAAEGLQTENEANIMIAESSGQFSAAVVKLLRNPFLRTAIGDAGRRTFEHHYTWRSAWKALDHNLQLSGSADPRGYTE